MNLIKFPRTLSRLLNVRRGNSRLDITLAVGFEDDISSLNELAVEILGPLEAKYYASLRFERRQRSYLLGRYTAKLALKQLLPETDFRSIEIVKGVFEQPVVLCNRSPGWSVTISHAESRAVALAYPSEHPMGIDIERIDSTHQRTILSQLSSEETKWAESSVDCGYRLATALWAAKEALSKALTTGLMSPIEVYSLVEFRLIDSGIWEGLFLNFAQYKAWVWTGSSYALSIAMPRRSMLYGHRGLCAIL